VQTVRNGAAHCLSLSFLARYGVRSFLNYADRPGRLIDNLNDCVGARINQHRMSIDDGVAVLSGTRIFRRHFIICHACLREHRTNTKLLAILVRRVMTFGNIAVEPGPIIDTQYTVDAAYDATDDATNNRSHGAGIVLTDASAMIRTFWYALSVCSGRHCERHGTNDYDVSFHMYL
jgi:hypothetical protein